VASGQEEQPERREQSNRGQHGIVVARPFGIPVYVSPYWFIIAGVFIVIYANDLSSSLSGSTRYVVAAAFVVLLYVSVLVHELSHSVVARGYGLPVRRILLYPLGGISEIEREAPTPGREFAVAAAGPALSLALGAAGWGLAQLVPYGVTGALIRQLVVANILVGLFNLLPGLPLDGGRMLRAVIWKITKKPTTATIAAAWVGRILALGVLAIPFFSGSLAGGDIVSVVWVVVIAGFMWTGASQSIKATRFRERLPALQARRLARKAISVPASTPLAEAIRQADEAGARAVVVVDHDSKPIAIVNEAAVMATPPQRRPWVDTGSMARTIDPGLILNADLQGMALLDAIRRAPATEYLLVDSTGQVVGVLTARDLDQVFAGVLSQHPLIPVTYVGEGENSARAVRGWRPGAAHRPQRPDAPDSAGRRRHVPHASRLAEPRRPHRPARRFPGHRLKRHRLRGAAPAARRLHASDEARRHDRLPEGRGPDPRLRRRLPRRPGP
jgi:Zn-dependent protease